MKSGEKRLDQALDGSGRQHFYAFEEDQQRGGFTNEKGQAERHNNSIKAGRLRIIYRIGDFHLVGSAFLGGVIG
jgi:hypothetical protein